MSKLVNYHLMILRALESFREGTPSSIEKGVRIAKRCFRSIDGSTLGGLVWGMTVQCLTDSVFYTNSDFLLETYSKVSGLVPSHEVILLNPDFLIEELSQEDTNLKDLLVKTVAFLDNIRTYEQQFVHEKFNQLSAEINNLKSSLPTSLQLENESIYRFILREIVDIILVIDIRRLVNSGILAPLPPYHIMHSSNSEPLIPHALDSIKRMLASLEGKDWLCVNIYFNKKTVFISFL